MRYLLDTHVFLWLVHRPERLTRHTIALLSDERERVFVSAVTNWEITVKRQKGLLAFDGSVSDVVGAMLFRSLPILDRHGDALTHLPLLHSDPFDRLLVAQAQMEDMTLISADRHIADYDVRLLRP